ncbi:MAG: nitrogen fixation protein NifH [Bellilinea sp.]
MTTNFIPSTSVMNWLLEPQDPGARYLAMKEIVEMPSDSPELIEARQQAYTFGQMGQVLAAMDDTGFWNVPGPGYNPKYYSTVWSLVLLAQLGASVNEDERIQRACNYYLDHALSPSGQITSSGQPSGTVDCLQGNISWALTVMGFNDPRMDIAYEWMARSVTGEGVAPRGTKGVEQRYYAGKCGPNFACGANDTQPCAWGAVKVMLAFSVLPQVKRTPLIESAVQAGVEFIFSVDPAGADYPHPYSAKPSGNWWKFGFPVFYITDLLQLVDAMTGLGYGQDPRLRKSIQRIREKQDAQGRWPLEYNYSGKTHAEFGEMKKPSKWVTIRALKVLKRLDALTAQP